ncbi:MAG: hypothetical protein HYR67_06150 [Bacteroidetes bacterium]|nr:hypothetical protein [Bacteroidota bacterium]
MNNVALFAVLIFLYGLLMYKAGKGFPILYLFLFTYFLQYIFSTYLIYNEYKSLSTQMPISQGIYFEYAIPALLFLFAGVFLFHKDVAINRVIKRIDPAEAARLGYLLLAISLCMDLLVFAGLSPLESVASFTGDMKYLAAFCFLFTRSKFNFFLIVLLYIQLALSVVKSGVFVSLFIWSLYLFFFMTLKYGMSFWVRSTVFVAFLPAVFAIQSVKDEYRKATWKLNQEPGVSLLSDLVEKKRAKDADDPFAETDGVVRTVGRLTEGWHLGLTLRHVPRRHDFAYGSEMFLDMVSSVLPRLIFENKKRVNSQDKFLTYTGHKLRGNTSMSIGVIGDFYINFGRWGSYITLFAFGTLIAFLLRSFTRRFVLIDPINIIWIPYLLSYLIRANNDFYIFFNGMIKGFIIFLLINYLRHRFWKPVHTQETFSKPVSF